MSTIKLILPLFAFTLFSISTAAENPKPFGDAYPNLDNLATGEWWTRGKVNQNPNKKPARPPKRIPSMDVPRDQVIAFALYTQDRGTLKLSAFLYPLKPGEKREARLELKWNDKWEEAASAEVLYPGWSAHFRLEEWDGSKSVPYRVRHGEKAQFEGLIRKDPIDQEEIVVGNLSCNSSRTTGPRPNITKNLLHQDPDLLFFAGDQTYHHTQHTAGWIQFGLQFRDVMKDRPTVTIPDDHDVGHGNLWGEGGIKAKNSAGHDGGYNNPPEYVNMVERSQTWHLPDAVDPKKIKHGIGVYFTNLRVGGVDFAIIEDRKFKSGPNGKIPKMGPRPDHINDPKYDRKAVDVEGLVLLGQRQLDFLHGWSQDWTGAEMKAVLSQTAFCGAVHKHGSEKNRLLADLDCNGWPQTGRNKALREIRRAWAVHLCGDQHLAVTVKHGIEAFGDGPYGFTSPAIVNTIYGRWWEPEDRKAGPNAIPDSPLPWTGDYLDGLGNRITMLAYANPPNRTDELQRADGHGLVRFNKKNREVTFECWHRFANVAAGDKQFAGWPITVLASNNDGRKIKGWLPKLEVSGTDKPVIQVIEEKSNEILYTMRAEGHSVQPRVYALGTYTVKIGTDLPDGKTIQGLKAVADKSEAGSRRVAL